MKDVFGNPIAAPTLIRTAQRGRGPTHATTVVEMQSESGPSTGIRRLCDGGKVTAITHRPAADVTCKNCQRLLAAESQIPSPPVVRIPKNTCTPDKIGSGPPDEFCKGCMFFRRVQGGARIYLKCGAMEHRWTRGPGSDIKANWPACSKWLPIIP